MYAHGLYSAWALWPLWTLHTIILILELAVLCYLVLDWDGTHHELPSGYTASLSFAFVNFVAEPLEMVLWTYHLLEPLMYLVFQILKAVLWTIVCGYGMFLLAEVYVFKYAWLQALLYVLVAMTLVSFYASLTYALVIFYKSNKSSGYEPPLLEKEAMAFRNSVTRVHGRGKSRLSEQDLARPISSVYSD